LHFIALLRTVTLMGWPGRCDKTLFVRDTTKGICHIFYHSNYFLYKFLVESQMTKGRRDPSTQKMLASGFSYTLVSIYHIIWQGCTNPGRQVSRATRYCQSARDVCGSSVWKLFHVNILESVILKRLLDF
jgi:hypothetical protein